MPFTFNANAKAFSPRHIAGGGEAASDTQASTNATAAAPDGQDSAEEWQAVGRSRRNAWHTSAHANGHTEQAADPGAAESKGAPVARLPADHFPTLTAACSAPRSKPIPRRKSLLTAQLAALSVDHDGAVRICIWHRSESAQAHCRKSAYDAASMCVSRRSRIAHALALDASAALPLHQRVRSCKATAAVNIRHPTSSVYCRVLAARQMARLDTRAARSLRGRHLWHTAPVHQHSFFQLPPAPPPPPGLGPPPGLNGVSTGTSQPGRPMPIPTRGGPDAPSASVRSGDALRARTRRGSNEPLQVDSPVMSVQANAAHIHEQDERGFDGLGPGHFQAIREIGQGAFGKVRIRASHAAADTVPLARARVVRHLQHAPSECTSGAYRLVGCCASVHQMWSGCMHRVLAQCAPFAPPKRPHLIARFAILKP